MAGLVGYDSTDEESIASDASHEPIQSASAEAPIGNGSLPTRDRNKLPSAQGEKTLLEPPKEPETLQESLFGADPGPAPAPAPATAILIGPPRPPRDADTLPSFEDANIDDKSYNRATSSPPLSPYSSERAAVRQLTMPRVPDFDIPGSPPDAERATTTEALAGLNTKFATFLELKQKKDTHFHARLAQSEAMKNPAVMDKLMAFVGMPAAGGDDAEDRKGNKTGEVDTAVISVQYRTTLPLDLWNPAMFPPEAYRRSLRKIQEEAAKQRARAPGERVKFVSSGGRTPGMMGAEQESR